MPRIQPSLCRHAKRVSPHLATLLPACRDLEAARNELRWIKSHVDDTYSQEQQRRLHLMRFCRDRGRGVPLQYILGSQPFGSLDIKCSPGVLIPRPETEAYTCYLVDLIKSGKLFGRQSLDKDTPLNVIDFCTGTGCIPLLLFSSLRRSIKNLHVRGVDISPLALQLSKQNVTRNIKLGNLILNTEEQTLDILQGDVFSESNIRQLAASQWDILVSNPPYISEDIWRHGRGHLGYSVRKYEPRLALVPDSSLPRPASCDAADVFYSRLLDIACKLKSKIILLEVGDERQARRVLQLYHDHEIANNSQVELWRDWPDFDPSEDDEPIVSAYEPDGSHWSVPARGSGLVRSVFIRRLKEEDG